MVTRMPQGGKTDEIVAGEYAEMELLHEAALRQIRTTICGETGMQ